MLGPRESLAMIQGKSVLIVFEEQLGALVAWAEVLGPVVEQERILRSDYIGPSVRTLDFFYLTFYFGEKN